MTLAKETWGNSEKHKSNTERIILPPGMTELGDDCCGRFGGILFNQVVLSVAGQYGREVND